ncbi:hypothetical protein SH661x_003790 [Planctomicrobium sp. SH661]|uniref:hypothetical protein n=1 Tax=Planctomicrobium sp. SH661 TaxID=3448124 RepID=UPI003F5C13C9
MLQWLCIAGLIVIPTAILLWLIFRGGRTTESQRALRLFKLRREALEAKFFDLAVLRGVPRGLTWVRCDWKPDVSFARDIETGLLTAFVGVEIHFEAIAGGEMEDVEAVGHFREASAVFHYQSGVWGTGGKALFNMSPAEAVHRLAGQYTPVETA